MKSLSPGDRIYHHLFGGGTVVRETRGGYLVKFDSGGGLTMEVGADTLTVERATHGRSPDSPEGMPGAPPAPVASGEVAVTRPAAGDTYRRPRRASSRNAAADPAVAEARSAIDALRFGVVPASHLADMTLGYNELVRWVESNLGQPGGPARAAAVYGPFGSGKSHTMAAIREIARARGYVAIATEIDGVEVSLAQPRELLSSLLDHLTSSSDLDGGAPLLCLLLLALEAGRKQVVGDRSPLFRETVATIERLSTTRRFDDLEDTVERLLGSDPNLTRTDFKNHVRETLDWDDYVRLVYDAGYSPQPLVSYSPVSRRPADFIQALLGYAAMAKRASLTGLVVTIDELEVETALSTPARHAKVIDFVAEMRAELRAARPVEGGLSIFFAAVGEDDSVEDRVVSLIVEFNPQESLHLRPRRKSDLLLLSETIHRLYAAAHQVTDAYDAGQAKAVLKLVDPNDAIRAFIRGYVARLDVMYGPPYH